MRFNPREGEVDVNEPLIEILYSLNAWFAEHLKAGLVSHQKYYQQLTTQYEKRIAQTRAEYERLKNDLHRQSLMEKGRHTCQTKSM